MFWFKARTFDRPFKQNNKIIFFYKLTASVGIKRYRASNSSRDVGYCPAHGKMFLFYWSQLMAQLYTTGVFTSSQVQSVLDFILPNEKYVVIFI